MTFSWNDMKLFSREELLSMVPKGFKFHTEPWEHQIAAFVANISNFGFLDALDLGTGKTKVAIDVARCIDFTEYNNKKKVSVLFVCLNTAIEKMRDEVHKHSKLSAVCVRGGKDKKWLTFNKKYNFYIINYEGLRSLLSERVAKGEKEIYDKKKERMIRKKIYKDVISKKAISKFLKMKFDYLVLDESHLIKTPKSLIFRIIKKLCIKYKRRSLLTGTPFGNTLLDIWSQYYVVDFGETYGLSFSIYKTANFEDKGWWGPIWVPTEKGEEVIKNKLYSKAIRYREDECNDLPPKVFRVLKYNLDKEQRELYDSLLDDEYTDLTKEIGSKAIGFRTICSGFIKSSDHIFKKNPKLDLLWDIIENVYKSHKVVVFTEYIISRQIIEKFIKKKKIKYNTLSGATKDKYHEYNTFQTNPDYRIMIANIKSGGTSIDLFAATYTIFYEIGGSLIQHKQALKRIHRGGQTKKCFFYYLLGNKTIEINIKKNLDNNEETFSNIADNKSARKYLMGL